MELIFSASLIAAFVAGIAALFAPCCITVLLPAYFASIFRERYKVFLMTFIFFLGILAVFLPMGLGAAALGTLFSQYHNTIFAIGGIFLTILGIILLSGTHISLPKVKPSLRGHNAISVFTLGVFSGIATTCCAPVLAGVLALSILPGSLLWGGIYTLSYVLGMVLPLFIISVFMDKANFAQKLDKIFRRQISYSFLQKQFRITVSEAISGGIFLGMGLLISYLAFSNRLFVHSSYQTDVNIMLTKVLNSVNNITKVVPEYIWAVLFIAIAALIVRFSIYQFKKESHEKNDITPFVWLAGLIVVAAALIYVGGQNKSSVSQNTFPAASNITATDPHGHNAPSANVSSAELNNFVGKPVPEFSLTDRNGNAYSSENLRGKNVVLFFNEGLMCYPACWNQIVALADDDRFENANAVALSIVIDSKDDWQDAVRKMPELDRATVVFDAGASVSRKFSVLTTPSSMHPGVYPGHTYVLVDKDGIVRYVLDDPNMGIRNDQLVAEITKLN